MANRGERNPKFEWWERWHPGEKNKKAMIGKNRVREQSSSMKVDRRPTALAY